MLTSQIIKDFIKTKKISDNEIIFIQKDGILTKKYVKISHDEIEKNIYPELRHVIPYIIFTPDKKQYMFKCEKTKRIITKGIQNKSIGLDDFLTEKLYYNNIFDFNFMNQLINDFFDSYDLRLYAIPKKDKLIFIMQDNVIEIPQNMIDKIDLDVNNINKHYYFTLYLENLLRSILINYI